MLLIPPLQNCCFSPACDETVIHKQRSAGKYTSNTSRISQGMNAFCERSPNFEINTNILVKILWSHGANHSMRNWGYAKYCFCNRYSVTHWQLFSFWPVLIPSACNKFRCHLVERFARIFIVVFVFLICLISRFQSRTIGRYRVSGELQQ